MTLTKRLRETVARRVRALPLVTSLVARRRKGAYERQIAGFLTRS